MQAIQLRPSGITVADTLAPVFLNQPDDVIEVNEQRRKSPTVRSHQDACDGNAQWSSEDLLLETVGDTAACATYVQTCGNGAF